MASTFDAVPSHRDLVIRPRSVRLDNAQIVLRRNAYRAAVVALSLGRPVAWRTRTFLSQPHFDVESRMLDRLERVDMRNADRFERLIERLNAQDRTTSLAMRESRKLFVSLRDLLEDQAEEIESLRAEVRELQAKVSATKPKPATKSPATQKEAGS